MDGSRDVDLRMLKNRYNDTSLPLHVRKKAYRKFQDILSQVRDTTLTELRFRLVKAHRAGDSDGAEKIEYEIREHSRKMGYGRA